MVAAVAGVWLMPLAPYPVSAGGLVPKWNLQPVSEAMGLWAPALSVALTLITASLLAYLNTGFNMLRGYSYLQCTMYLCMLIAVPMLLATFSTAVVLPPVLVLCSLLLFSIYAQRDGQRHIFTVFLLLSAASAFDYSFAVYLPVMWLALGQMRIFSARSLLASLMGLVTPWIIFFGFGLLRFSDMALPAMLSFELPDSDNLQAISVLATAGFTIFISVVCWLQNVMKIYSYNMQSRAQLGLIVVIQLVTIVAMCLNLPHCTAFIPTIMLCTALQAAHTFAVIYTSPKAAIAILLLILIYLAIYAWRLLVYILP